MPKIVKPLTDKEVKNFQPKEKDYKVSDGKGLMLVVRPNRTKYWKFDFTYGKRKSMSFGVYPEISLKDARFMREEARKLLKQGINPIDERQRKKNEKLLLFNDILEEWLEFRSRTISSNTIKNNRRIFKNITVTLGNKPISDIYHELIIDILQHIQKKGRIETAHRLYSLLDKFYKYAVVKRYVPHNIIADIDKDTILIKNNSDNHLAAITEPEEIKLLLKDLKRIESDLKSNISTVYIFKLLPYVFVRSNNIRLMRWKEIDFDNNLWIIPKEKMKMKIDFVFPLPRQAVKLLKEIEPFSKYRSEFVFPSPLKNDRGVAGATISGTLTTLGYQNKHTAHGFRATFSTNANILKKVHGFDSEIIELCLAHKEKNKVKAAYDREEKFKYIEEKRELVQWYADWIDTLRED